MATKYFSQLSYSDYYKECTDIFESDPPTFFVLLKSLLIKQFTPNSFYSAFYKYLDRDRDRDYPLLGFLTALILQKIFSIPSNSLLILFLHICKELRELCGFTKVLDASKFKHFKQDSLPYNEQMFSSMVDFTMVHLYFY